MLLLRRSGCCVGHRFSPEHLRRIWVGAISQASSTHPSGKSFHVPLQSQVLVWWQGPQGNQQQVVDGPLCVFRLSCGMQRMHPARAWHPTGWRWVRFQGGCHPDPSRRGGRSTMRPFPAMHRGRHSVSFFFFWLPGCRLRVSARQQHAWAVSSSCRVSCARCTRKEAASLVVSPRRWSMARQCLNAAASWYRKASCSRCIRGDPAASMWLCGKRRKKKCMIFFLSAVSGTGRDLGMPVLYGARGDSSQPLLLRGSGKVRITSWDAPSTVCDSTGAFCILLCY